MFEKMLKKFISLAAVCTLLAAIAACEKPVPGREDITVPDEEQEKDEGQEQEKEEEKGEGSDNKTLDIREAIKDMGAGWNLGNTLDANSGDTTNMWIEHWTARLPSDYEIAWGQLPATREFFQMMKEAGFRSIRVPVTWYPHMGARFEFESYESSVWYPSKDPIGDKVDDVWMARVKEVVDYIIAEDMYCILNVHHDTGTANTHWIIASEENHTRNSARFKSLWTQIANTFKDYDGHLLFEGYNEMTDQFDSWCFASFNSPDRYDAEAAAASYRAINAYAQDFVDAVRATGGNNLERNLIVNTYAACSGGGNWNIHLLDPLTEMKLPEDKTDGHLAFQVHYYPYLETLDQGKKDVDTFFSIINNNLVNKGAPVIVGEWGCSGDCPVTYDKNRPAYLEFAEYFVKKAKENGSATFYWMGISDGNDRSVPRFTQPDLKDAIIRGSR